MAMLQRPFIIVTKVESQITSSPQLDGLDWLENGEGVRAAADRFAMLDFEGRPNLNLRARMTEHAIVALSLPDLVLLHHRTGKLIENAVLEGVLDLSGYSGQEGLPRG